MIMKLVREVFTEETTIGSLYIDDVFECYTLEDRTRAPGIKVYGRTAIPYGEYEVALTWSPKYRAIYPQILDVPNFTGIRIHSGNFAQDTEGCVLVGKIKMFNRILMSRIAFAAIRDKLAKNVLLALPCRIIISSIPPGRFV